MNSNARPLCVDLDETLLRTNTFMESILALVRARPLFLFLIPLWVGRGHAYCWSRLAQMTSLDVRLLPYRRELLAFLRQERSMRHEVVLVTGAHQDIADRIAAHCGVFSSVVATTSGGEHIVGRRKRDLLVESFGSRGYDYVGATNDDIDPWLSAHTAYVVGSSTWVRRRLSRHGQPTIEIPSDYRSIPLIRALRPHQWAKNLLVFVPLVLSHQWTHYDLVARAIVVAIAFNCLASAIYIINDLIDLDSDRRHPTKQTRPFASGGVQITTGLVMTAALLCITGMLGVILGLAVSAVLLLYACAAVMYSFYLKRVMIIDVTVLAGLYCIRIYAGAIATDIPVSPWTFAFSLFGFMSVALMKRYSELFRARDASLQKPPGRGYLTADLPMIGAIGVGSGMLSVLVVALYITDPDTHLLYSHSDLLSILCPLGLMAIARMWIISGRGHMDEDPLLFAMRDRFCILAVFCAALVVLLAR